MGNSVNFKGTKGIMDANKRWWLQSKAIEINLGAVGEFAKQWAEVPEDCTPMDAFFDPWTKALVVIFYSPSWEPVPEGSQFSLLKKREEG